ncbi:hypothetical protein AWN90_07730 [Nocardia terpenica]|uniref:ESX secretion-associated protein EspG n=1 Tax=Nocardia terpenica TaxID=455432 RepID=A0A164IQD3_9NOCA|nr:hypothetical protein AWN90_07730 [Nocardia terpenica]
MYAWGQMRWDRIPAPLVVRPEVESLADWEAIESGLRQRLPVLDDPDLLPVLRTATDPDISLVLVGARKKPLRAYGAVTANIGVTMVQRPGPDPDSGGNIVVEVGSPALVPKVFAAVAGDQPAGRIKNMVETWERVENIHPVNGFVDDQTTVAEKMRRLLAAPRIGYGHIEVHLDRHSPRPLPRRYVSWFDVDGDGRYLYTRRYGDLHIEPCANDRFRQTITQLMEQ